MIMAFKLVKYGIPLSFVYCTIYQQSIWREGDEDLLNEQRDVWTRFLGSIGNVYGSTLETVGLKSTPSNHKVISKLENLSDMRYCWNAKVMSTFESIDQLITNPMASGCKIYRKIQPYISSTGQTTTKSAEK